ncbi:unnamed protein product [Prunus armeniaca]
MDAMYFLLLLPDFLLVYNDIHTVQPAGHHLRRKLLCEMHVQANKELESVARGHNN